MAKYVEYTPDVFSQPDGCVNVWWFPITFSQSQLGDRIIGSNACTLIAVLLAGRMHEFKIMIWGFADQPLSRMLVTSLADAIVVGNDIHEKMIEDGTVTSVDLTVVEALNAASDKYPQLIEWYDRTIYIMEPLGDTLAENLLPAIVEFDETPPDDKQANSDLYAVLVADGRTVLFIYQPDTSKVTVMDSHAHAACLSGAVIAQAKVGDLEHLCNWFSAMLDRSFERGSRVYPYEVTFLYFKEEHSTSPPSTSVGTLT